VLALVVTGLEGIRCRNGSDEREFVLSTNINEEKDDEVDWRER